MKYWRLELEISKKKLEELDKVRIYWGIPKIILHILPGSVTAGILKQFLRIANRMNS